MDHPSRPRRWHTRPILPGVLLGLLLVVTLSVTLILAPAQVRTRFEAMIRAVTGWVWPTSWAWPLAAALTLAVLTSPPARRRWFRPAHRISAAIGIFVGLVGLANLATGSRPGIGLLRLGVAVTIGLLATWVLVVPRRLAPPVPSGVLGRLNDRDRLEVADARIKLQNDVRTTALQAIAGLAVLAGALLAFQQLTEDRQQAAANRDLTRQGQASERFTRAIDQLGSNRREVQLGGIYGLEQIARQAPDNRLAVTEVLVAYLHRRVSLPVKPPRYVSMHDELRTRVPDAQAALTVLGRRQTAPTDPPLDLRGLDLRVADLRHANLSRANLSSTLLLFADLSDVNLSDANLSDTDLAGADLSHANLKGADLSGVDLSDTRLAGADLSGADVSGTNVSGADLSRANLAEAELRSTDLSRTHLNDANLSGADLDHANLSRADLSRADLSGADLSAADLSLASLNHANLRGTDLLGADLTHAGFRGAIADQRTAWNGFDWQRAGVRMDSGTGP